MDLVPRRNWPDCVMEFENVDWPRLSFICSKECEEFANKLHGNLSSGNLNTHLFKWYPILNPAHDTSI